MPDPLGALVFALSTAFALTVDVGMYALAVFATAPRPRAALRFAGEIAVAHAALLAAGAVAAETLVRGFGSDLPVDIAAGLALLVVLRGAWNQARLGYVDAPEAPDSSGVSWLIAFALSIDAFLIGPAAREYTIALAPDARVAVFLAIFSAVAVLAWTYAAFARRWNTRMRAGGDGGLAIAIAAEIVIFTVFFADASFRALAHAGSEVGPNTARGLGVLAGLALFALARRSSRRSKERSAP